MGLQRAGPGLCSARGFGHFVWAERGEQGLTLGWRCSVDVEYLLSLRKAQGSIPSAAKSNTKLSVGQGAPLVYWDWTTGSTRLML